MTIIKETLSLHDFPKALDMALWCNKTVEITWWRKLDKENSYWYFESDDDATAFALVWL